MNEKKRTYDTLSEGINDLIKRGYKEDFNLKSNCIECKALALELSPEMFEIDETHRFEGDTNPSDSSILFAISSKDGSIKGTMVDAYGVYANSMNAEMIKKLNAN